MGTRGLLGLIIQAQRHATYNHFDSYPKGLGSAIVQFILSLKPEDYAKMDALVREITVRNITYLFPPRSNSNFSSTLGIEAADGPVVGSRKIYPKPRGAEAVLRSRLLQPQSESSNTRRLVLPPSSSSRWQGAACDPEWEA
jgi:hypothetical protein